MHIYEIDTLGEKEREEGSLYKPRKNWKPFKQEWVKVSFSTPFTWTCAISVLWWKQQAGNIRYKNEIKK